MMKPPPDKPKSIVFIDDAHTFGGAQIAMAWAIRVLLRNTTESIVCVSSSATWKAVAQIAGEQTRLTYIECPSALPLNLFTFPIRLLPFFFLLRRIKQQGARAWWLNLSGIEFCLAPRFALALLGERPEAWLHNTERFTFFYKRASFARRVLSRLRDIIADRVLFRLYKRLITPSLSSVTEVQRRIRDAPRPVVMRMYYPMITPQTPPVGRASIVQELPSNVLNLWMIGRVEYGHKNNEVALEVLISLITSGREAHLTVVGDGPDMEDFRRRVAEGRLTEQVTMLGWQTYPWEQVPSNAMIFIPSVYESMSLVAREAMIRGLRVVASPIPVFLEWSPHALLAKDFSAASFTEKVQEIETMGHEELLALYSVALARFSDDLLLSTFYSYTEAVRE
jgi:glycosyltransferase involved in cell wall biosynthesis